MSMKPGATTCPPASMVRAAGHRAGIAPEDAERVALHAHGGVVAGVAAAVDDEAVTDQQIEHGHSCQLAS
jgi:hypothetical protein